MVPGDSAVAPRSVSPSRTPTSTHTAYPAWLLVDGLKLTEPPWYGPVCPVVWEGGSREAPPYPNSDEGKRELPTALVLCELCIDRFVVTAFMRSVL